eukprot:jgi/Ulvmu1/10602/UM065_0058.1
MSKLHTIEDEVLSLELGHEVHRQYTSFAKQVMAYEKLLFKQWVANIECSAMGYLKMNILSVDPENSKVVANFSKGLVRLMRETRYLDRMGFEIPEIALNVTLQEESYSKRVEDLELMLALYYSAMKSVPSSEAQILQPIVKELESSLEPGFHVLNWNSLGISDFTQQCRKAINEFNTRVGQALKNMRDIEVLVASIASAELLPDVDDSTVPMLQEFYESVEKHRLAVVENLVKKYRTIPQLLGKMEEVIAGTNSGKSKQMLPYYQYWERCIFNALNGTVLHAMAKLSELMLQRSGRPSTAAGERTGSAKMMPLFKIHVSLSNPEVLVSPTLADTAKILSKLWRNMVESTKSFIRWMDGTCLETPEQASVRDDEESFVFSFYNDVQMNPLVIKAILALDNPIRQAINCIKQYVNAPD